MRARLFLRENSDGTPPLVLDSFPVFLGIGEDTRLQISETASADCRCQIQLEEGTLVATDVQSSAGTWVNGESIERAPLMPGDRLQIGPRTLVVSYERLNRQAPPDVVYRSLSPDAPNGVSSEVGQPG